MPPDEMPKEGRKERGRRAGLLIGGVGLEVEAGAEEGSARERKREEMGAKKPPVEALGPSRQTLTCAWRFCGCASGQR